MTVPGGTLTPGSPSAPCGPAGPVGPAGPIGPATPDGSCTVNVIACQANTPRLSVPQNTNTVAPRLFSVSAGNVIELPTANMVSFASQFVASGTSADEAVPVNVAAPWPY